MSRMSGFAIVVCVIGLVTIQAPVQAEETVVTAGEALDLMFDPPRAPNVKGRGALQRTSFKQLLAGSERELQIAFVIDGTDSMGKDITSVLKTLPGMAGDLHKRKGEKNVSFGLVVYRDVGAKSGPVELPLGDSFTADVGRLKSAVAQIHSQTGEPYFPELIDLGISTAIQKLKWKDSKDVSRWVIVFGDAPPYDEGFHEPETGAKRQVSTKDLISQAKANRVNISCIVCEAGFAGDKSAGDAQLLAAWKESSPKLRKFVADLTNQTKGVVWDLSQQHVREALVAAAQQERFPTQEIVAIKQTHLDERIAKANSQNGDDAPANRVRLAILPHRPLEEMAFDPEDPAVNVAAEMRSRFGQVPSIEVVNAGTLQEKFQQAIAGGVEGESELLQKVAIDTRADYIIWGDYQAEGEKITLESGIYDKVDGSQVVKTKKGPIDRKKGETSIVFTVAGRLARNMAAAVKSDDAGVAKTFAQVSSDDSVSKSFNTPVSSSPRAAREIWAGFESLEQSLAYEKFDADAKQKLETAVLKLNAAKTLDPKNPFVHSLLASTYFNLAQTDRAEDRVQQYLKALQKAFTYRDQAMHDSLRVEIEADFALLIDQDVKQAIKLYESLTTAESGKIQMARRAHWMLAGIYCGDWGVASEHVDSDKARQHIITIMSVFEGSPEDKAYRKVLEWSEKDGTRHPHVQKKHTELAKK